MAAPNPDSITIGRAHFETLLRRANNNDGLAAGLEDIVSVSREEYENLLLVSRQFANLKQNLMGAGVTEENIATLIQDCGSVPQDHGTAQSSHLRERTNRPNPSTRLYTHHTTQPTYNTGKSTSRGNSGQGNAAFRDMRDTDTRLAQTASRHDWADPDPAGDDFSPPDPANNSTPEMAQEHTFAPFGQMHNVERPHYPRICRRTIALLGLAESTSHWDITSVIRGGQLLDIFIRFAERSANVSFLLEDDATRFYDHARKHDIYINNKRVFVRWADRHFHLAAHVASNVANGATRNLIIRRCDPSNTEDSIRDDLEHIHNLTVIKIDFSGASCYIKTNSVQNAMYARTCMMSRAKYKGSKIEWDVDECQQPIEAAPKAPTKPQAQQAPMRPGKSTGKPVRNRFDMLRLDDDDNNDESDDKFDTSSEMPGTVGVTA
ncbi:hypothetical protein GGR56DRAFT_292395 [Xylariaceae sp. FL0804]|nr:hypothetical protein GGR56DRAFT_292395 [Xylariaceae sp. FL0804]